MHKYQMEPITMTMGAMEVFSWLSSKLGKFISRHPERQEFHWYPHPDRVDEDGDEDFDEITLCYKNGLVRVDVWTSHAECEVAAMVLGYCVLNGIPYRAPDQIIEDDKREKAMKEKMAEQASSAIN